MTIREDAAGRVDLEHLEYELARHAHHALKIGAFSAASNVTGIVTDVDRVAIALHRHGALSLWDYASAGPYLPIDMNPSPDIADGHLAYKDAVCISPHKFVGGPGTPGVLVAKRALFANKVPTVPSGGTILFVSPTRQSYHPEPAIREEGGTPAIVESIRAGLVFALKEAVGAQEIRRREDDFARRALESLQANPQIEILGNPDLERLAILSLGFKHPAGLLHANFVVAVLSDLFGIQARSGCFCAGPYIHRMYPIDDDWSQRMDAEVAKGQMGAKLAFTRLSFNYFMSETVFQYILDAVHLIANEGWRLLPLYSFDPGSGLWRHADAARSGAAVAERRPGAGRSARDRARECAARLPRAGPGAHPRARRGATAGRGRTRADARLRAHPLVPAAGRGAAPPCSDLNRVSCLTPRRRASHRLRRDGARPIPSNPSGGEPWRLWTRAGSSMPCDPRAPRARPIARSGSGCCSAGWSAPPTAH